MGYKRKDRIMKIGEKHDKLEDMLTDCMELLSEIYVEADTSDCEDDPIDTLDRAMDAVRQINT